MRLASRPMTIWRTIAEEAAIQSELWAEVLLPEGEREEEPVFSALCAEPYALGLETIYEGYLAHFGRPRLFAVPDHDRALLLGDYLYAHGLVRVAEVEDVEAIEDLAALIAICARLRAEGGKGDAELWAATSATLGNREGLLDARDAFEASGDPAPLLELAQARGEETLARALAAHAARLG